MGECHKCRHSKDVGLYADVEFSQSPCAACVMTGGERFVLDFDEELHDEDSAVAVSQPAPEPMVEDVHFPEEPDAEQEQLVPVTVLWELIVTLLQLPPRTRDVVCWRYAGYTYLNIARVQHVTAPAVLKRHKEALSKHPLLRCLCPTAFKREFQGRHAVGRMEERR